MIIALNTFEFIYKHRAPASGSTTSQELLMSSGSATASFNTRQFGSNTKATGTIRVTTGYDAGTVGGLTEYDNAANEMHFMGDLA